GFALIGQALDDDVVQAIADAGRFRALVWENCAESYVGEDQRELRVGFLDRAKQLHRDCLRMVARADAINEMLRDLLHPRVPISHGEASAMIAHMLGAMGKRRSDDVTAKILALADMFNPATNALGEALGLWKPVPTSAAILALAIKTILAKQTF